ncbi:MAG: rod shape-determining protein MreC [Clostridiales bacterium]|uniref:rod shape-determining protein MreC n=1 Tax=Clostridium sp. N3C TaxID=1776758 RepID=UPI00092E0B9D|nr:rod shape-determining protein MreC [Clostridium sp. N3C]NLZ48517.1 rod shape-determining protein MreC [Clostridiales bacterium]SCN21726.1 Rod shape-determining protein MreC [Clostridium sp. N3C]
MKFLKNKLAVVVVILSVTFLVLIAASVKRENKTILENGAGSVLNSIQGFFYSINDNINSFFSFIFNFKEIKNENEALRERNAELEEKALMYDVVKSENERLAKILDYTKRNNQYDYVVSEILSVSGNNVLDGYVIDKGIKDGVIKGRVVATAQGLVGQVTVASDTWSIVQSISNENIGVGAKDQNTGDTGILRGYKDGNQDVLAILDFISMDSQIKVGDVIVTSGDGYIYPKGIRIGEVIEVQEDKSRVMKTAIVKPYVDLNRLEEVFVILPKDRSAEKYIGEELQQ